MLGYYIQYDRQGMFSLLLQHGMKTINLPANNHVYQAILEKVVFYNLTEQATALIQHAPFEIKNTSKLMVGAIHNNNLTVLKTLIETVKPTAEILDAPVKDDLLTWTVVKAALQSHNEEIIQTVLEAYPLGQKTPSWYNLKLEDIHYEYGRLHNHDRDLSQLQYDIKTSRINFHLKKGRAIWNSLQRQTARDYAAQTTNDANATCIQPAKPIVQDKSKKVHTKA